MNMHKNFGEWYRQVSIPCTDESLKKRWAGVESWVTTVRSDVAALLETVRIFRRLPEKASREAFLAAFRTPDATFGQRDNAHEQQVLAGASLVHCVGTGKKADDEGSVQAAVIAATALEASGLRAVDVNRTLDEQMGEVRAGLHTIALEQRRRRPFETILVSSEEEEVFKTTIATNVGDHNQLRANFEKAFQTLLSAVNRSESVSRGTPSRMRPRSLLGGSSLTSPMSHSDRRTLRRSLNVHCLKASGTRTRRRHCTST
jgi:hypothetical protein